MPSSRIVSASLALLALVAPAARAAEVTDVADAVDGEDPFDAHLEVKFDIGYKHGLLVRENTQVPQGGGAPRTVDVREMDYERFQLRLMPRLEIGVFRDLSVFAQWPIILYQQSSFRFTDGTNKANSTIYRDTQQQPGIAGWDQTGGSGSQGLGDGGTTFGYPAGKYNAWRFDLEDEGKYEAIRQGFDNPTVGVRFSPVNNERDDTKPTITLQADYTAPLMPFMLDPDEQPPTRDRPGAVADGAHRFHFQIAMSKRYALLDPYFVVDYTAPFASSSSYFDFEPRHEGGFKLGMEIVPYEDDALDQKFAIDLAASAAYLSAGRDYSEVSDVLGEVTYTDQFMRGGLHAGLFFRAFSYVFVDITGSVFYDTDHILTNEKVGEDAVVDGRRVDDTNGNGVCDADEDECGQVELDPKQGERNYLYNPVYDTPGRRFKLHESITGQLMIHLAVTF